MADFVQDLCGSVSIPGQAVPVESTVTPVVQYRFATQIVSSTFTESLSNSKHISPRAMLEPVLSVRPLDFYRFAATVTSVQFTESLTGIVQGSGGGTTPVVSKQKPFWS